MIRPLMNRIGVASALLATALAASASTLDQSSPDNNSSYNSNAANLSWQQKVVTGLAGVLSSVDLFGTDERNAVFQPFRFSINRGSGWQSDADDFSTVVTPVQGIFSIDVSGANLSFTAGEAFSIGFQGLGPVGSCCTLSGSAFPGLYAPGALFLNGSIYEGGGYDLAFNTHVAAVPEPASVLLMTAGLAAMGWVSRRRRAKAGL